MLLTSGQTTGAGGWAARPSQVLSGVLGVCKQVGCRRPNPRLDHVNAGHSRPGPLATTATPSARARATRSPAADLAAGRWMRTTSSSQHAEEGSFPDSPRNASDEQTACLYTNSALRARCVCGRREASMIGLVTSRRCSRQQQGCGRGWPPDTGPCRTPRPPGHLPAVLPVKRLRLLPVPLCLGRCCCRRRAASSGCDACGRLYSRAARRRHFDLQQLGRPDGGRRGRMHAV